MSAMMPWIPGARVVDLCAGTGALGLECLSRGAVHATFVERSRRVLGTLDRNLDELGAGDRATVISMDVLRWLRSPPARPFDLALADPPYGTGLALEVARAFRAAPFATSLWLEHARSEPLPPDFDPVRERRYGDTLISVLAAPDAAPDPSTAAPGDAT